MILRNATIKYKGYDPDTLSKFSHKKICVSCDDCGKIRWIEFKHYHNLCLNCSKRIKNLSKETRQKLSSLQMGELNHQYGKCWSEKSKEKLRQSLINHHYIYDHSDLSKYTMLVTRRQHGNIHKCLNRLGIKVPHINEV